MIDTKRNLFTFTEAILSKIFPFLANNLAILIKN